MSRLTKLLKRLDKGNHYCGNWLAEYPINLRCATSDIDNWCQRGYIQKVDSYRYLDDASHEKYTNGLREIVITNKGEALLKNSKFTIWKFIQASGIVVGLINTVIILYQKYKLIS